MIYLSAAKRVRATLLADARRIQPGRCCTLECKFHFATLHRHRERERERERIFSPRWTCPAFRLVYFDLFVPRIPLSVLSLLCYSVFQFPRKKKKQKKREKRSTTVTRWNLISSHRFQLRFRESLYHRAPAIPRFRIFRQFNGRRIVEWNGFFFGHFCEYFWHAFVKYDWNFKSVLGIAESSGKISKVFQICLQNVRRTKSR